MPKNEGNELARDTRWYYRAVIRGEQISEIARKDGARRQTVQQGIKRVRPLVEICVLPPAGAAGTRRTKRPSARTARTRKDRRRV